MDTPILTVQELTTPLRVGQGIYNVVDRLSFNLYRGKTLALVGESGCGKTMAALSIMRILPKHLALPSQGKILYQGDDLLKVSEAHMRKIRGARIAMIFQDPNSALNPVYTILSQLLEVAEIHLNIYGEAALLVAIKALEEVGIASPKECLSAYPHQISGGMKQRVMIAMALMCKPDILIADEPTTALDVTIQAQVLDLIRRLQAREGLAVLLITHDMGVVAEMADDVIVMYASQAVERAEAIELFDNMSHPYTIGLFQSRPSPDKHQKRLYSIKGNVPSLTHYPHGCRFHTRCPFVMPKCKQGDVPDFAVQASSSHYAKCWLLDGTLESAMKGQATPEIYDAITDSTLA